MKRFSKWLQKKAHDLWARRIFKKYIQLQPYQLWTEERQREAFLEAYVETGDIRCLIDYFQLRRPQDYRYFEKAFRRGLVETVFRRYDEVRYVLVDYWHGIVKLSEQNEIYDELLKKHFGK